MDVVDDSGRLYITPGLAPSEGQSNTAEGAIAIALSAVLDIQAICRWYLYQNGSVPARCAIHYEHAAYRTSVAGSNDTTLHSVKYALVQRFAVITYV
jgi:hypothetical protein